MASHTEKDNASHVNSSDSQTPTVDGVPHMNHMSREEREVAEAAARYGYGPLSRNLHSHLPAFGNSFQQHAAQAPAPTHRKFANPAPLGLCGFALTTFVLSLINMQTRGIITPNIVVASAFGYGGLAQLLSGMWEMAVGNTFGATALSSYGAFWISYAIIYTPGFQIITTMTEEHGKTGLNNAVGFWLFGWWIFTLLLLVCTIRTSWVFFSLFLTLDLAFFFLAVGHFVESGPGVNHVGLIKTGGFFGLLAAFLAWYVALVQVADSTNHFIKYPMFEFPWNPARQKTARDNV